MTRTGSGPQLFWANDGGTAETSPQQLDEILDELHEQWRDEELPLVVTLTYTTRPAVDFPPTLSLSLGREWSVLVYDDADHPDVNLMSVGDAAPPLVDELICEWGDDFTYYSPKHAVPVEYAREAARQFCGNSAPPRAVAWVPA